jgi:hypothetical protein
LDGISGLQAPLEASAKKLLNSNLRDDTNRRPPAIEILFRRANRCICPGNNAFAHLPAFEHGMEPLTRSARFYGNNNSR